MISRYIKYSSRFGNLVILFLFTIDIGRSFAGKHNLSNISDTKMSYQAYLNIAVLVTYIANRWLVYAIFMHSSILQNFEPVKCVMFYTLKPLSNSSQIS